MTVEHTDVIVLGSDEDQREKLVRKLESYRSRLSSYEYGSSGHEDTTYKIDILETLLANGEVHYAPLALSVSEKVKFFTERLFITCWHVIEAYAADETYRVVGGEGLA